MGKRIVNTLQKILIIFLILFGIFISYQLIRKIFGGSWQTEDIIIALLIFTIGGVFTLVFNLSKLNSDFNHLKNQFRCLANDFKDHTTSNKT